MKCIKYKTLKSVPVILFLISTIWGLSCRQQQNLSPVYEIKARDFIPEGTPIRIDLTKSGNYAAIKDLTDGSSIPIQFIDSLSLLFLLNGSMQKEDSRTYQLLTPEEAPAWKLDYIGIREGEASIEIYKGNQTVLRYYTAIQEPPEGTPSYYRRSGFIHPLYSPEGLVLTDGFPVGHTHQHGIFHAWVNTTFRNDSTDFWNQHQQTGTIRHLQLLSSDQGPVFADFTAQLEYLQLRNGDSIPALTEELTVRVYNHRSPFLIDLMISQRSAGRDTLFVNKYHYGGLAFRGSAQWNEEDPAIKEPMKVLTSEGKDRMQANHTRPYWIAAYGQIGDRTGGIVMMGSPKNFRFPQPVRVHPQMPYFCFAPMVDGIFAIAPGKTYEGHYRLVAYDGEPDTDSIQQIWGTYHNPPLIRSGSR